MPEPAGFVYVETALGALNRRNRVRHIRDVVALSNTGAERYISHARGDDALVEWPRTHVNSSGNGTVEGFAGKVWDASLRFDFDNRDNPAVALEWVRDFMARLALADVPLEALRVYFSGAKGFHVEIPHTLFGGFEPDENLHVWEKAAAVELMGSTPFDHAVYDKLRLWRLTNSFNSHGGHYKVRLSTQEALSLDMPAILALAEHPRSGLETAPDDDWNANPYLVEVWARARSGQAAPQIATDVFAESVVPWSTLRSSAIFDATLVTAIAESWPRTPIISRHSDFLLPLSGFLARQGMEESSISALLKAAAQQANDRSFLDDRTRHWEAEIERLAHDSAQKIAAGQPAQGLPTIVKNWPELGDYLNTVFVARAHTEYAAESPDDYHLAGIPRFPIDVLPEPMQAFVRLAQRMGLPANLACGAAVAAVAGAAGGMVEIEGPWTDRMVLWVVLLAPRGAGKSPVQSMAFKPLRDYDVKAYREYQDATSAWRAQKAPDRANSEAPRDKRLRLSDSTMSAIARRLQYGSGSIIWDADELSKLLLTFGEYQRGTSSADRARFLELWTGEQWQYERVGTGSKGGNDVDILIEKPTMVVCGGLQTGLHGRLGGEEDGLRPRWLPHLSDLRSLQLPDGGLFTPGVWDTLLLDLLSKRALHRGWRLDASALAAFSAHQRRWKQRAQAMEGSSVSAALQKADVHLLRIIGVFCEAENPGKGGLVEASMVERAALYMDAILDCWRALPEQERLSLTFKDERLDGSVDRVVDWLEQRDERQAYGRDILHAHVGGIRNSDQLKAVLERYESIYKGCVISKPAGPQGGRPGVLVLAPRRRPWSESGVSGFGGIPDSEMVEEVSCQIEGVASHTPESSPVAADSDLETLTREAEVVAAVGFVDEGLLTPIVPEEPGQQTVAINPGAKLCRACGIHLSEAEERAGFGLHFDCTMPFESTS